MKISKKEVQHIASLARIGLTPTELEKYSQELSKILEYVDKLNEVDTKNVEPTAQVTDLENITCPDQAVPFKKTKKILENTPELERNQIKVKGVFDEPSQA